MLPFLDTMVRRAIVLIGRSMGVLVVLLVLVIMFDILTRGRFFIRSTSLQELEWHLHTTVLMLCLGYAYLTDGHVRIGLLRDRWSPRTRAAVEAAGCILLLLPFCGTAAWYGIDYASLSFAQGEGSPSPGGLPYRWIVKATVPTGMILLMLAGLSVAARAILEVLHGPSADRPIFEEAAGNG